MNVHHVFAASLVFGATIGYATNSVAQQTSAVPPSTNPTERVIYPSEGQTAEQQLSDQLQCYNWSTQQAAWDPHQAYGVLKEKHEQALGQAEAAQGGAVRGAAGGALAGLAIGAVAGGITGGMRSRRQRRAAQSSFDQDVAAYQEQLQKWDRNYVACMQGRKYVVN